MSEFINTVDIVGDAALTDSIIDKSVVEIVDNRITKVGARAFYSCSALTTVNLPAATIISEYGFYNCKALTTVNLPAATRIDANAFILCSALTTVNLPAAKNIGNAAFYSCSKMAEAHMPAVTSIGEQAFEGCSSLTKLDFAENLTSIPKQAFVRCSGLATVNFPAVTSIREYAFQYCQMVTADFSAVKSIASYAFSYNSKFERLILRGETVCSLAGTNAFTSTPFASGKGHIYVPAALVDSYKSQSGWSSYTSKFRALEDYTVDGTITGELDESKI